jgi:hypothetical protein
MDKAVIIVGIIAEIVDWFRTRQSLKAESPDNIAFSLLTRLDDGTVEVVIGIFSVCPQSRLLCGQTLHFLA